MLFDVMEATETTMKINRCLEDDNHCNRQAAALCRIRCFYVDLQELIDTKLKKKRPYGIYCLHEVCIPLIGVMLCNVEGD